MRIPKFILWLVALPYVLITAHDVMPHFHGHDHDHKEAAHHSHPDKNQSLGLFHFLTDMPELTQKAGFSFEQQEFVVAFVSAFILDNAPVISQKAQWPPGPLPNLISSCCRNSTGLRAPPVA